MAGAAFASSLLSSHVYVVNIVSMICFLGTMSVISLIPHTLGRASQVPGGGEPLLDSSEHQGFLSADSDEQEPVGESIDNPPDHTIEGGKNKVSAIYHTSHAPEVSVDCCQLSIPMIFVRSCQSSWRSMLTIFSIPNPTLTVIALLLASNFAQSIQVLLPQYSSLQLQWPLATSNAALAVKSLSSAVVSIVLPTLRTLFLESHMTTVQVDLLITRASIAVSFLGMLGLGASTIPVTFILSLCLYTLGQGLVDSLTAYGTITLGPDQKLGEFYVRTCLVQTLAAITAAPIWSTTFAVVLKDKGLPLGMPFYFCAACFALSWLGARYLR